MAELDLGSQLRTLMHVLERAVLLPPTSYPSLPSLPPSRCLISFIFNLHSECRKPLLAVNIRESEPKHILEGFPVWDF